MKKILAILLSVVMLLGCVVISTAADENDAPTFHPVSATEPTVLNIIEKGAWSENNLEPGQHNVPLNVLEDSVHDFRFGDTATFNINVAKAGTYTLALTHIWAAPSNWTISIDDAEAIPVVISKSPNWDAAVDAALGAYELTAGDHTITLTCVQEDGGQHIYALTVTPLKLEPEAPATEYEVEVDHKGVAEGHGLTITNGVGGLSLSYQFKTTAAFKAFSAKLGYLEAGKYFNVSITERGSDEPIQTWTSNGFDASIGSVAWVSFELDEALTAGEYIVIISPESGLVGDILWKRYDVQDDYGIWESVGSFEGEKETARNSTPAFKVTFTEEVADGAYFAKAGEEIVAPETTAPETAAPETAAPETDAPVEPETPVEPEEPAYDIEGGKANFVPVVGNSDYTVQIAEIASCAHGQMLVDLRSGDVLNFKVNIKEAGTYDLSFGYIWQWGTDFKVSVDGAEEVVVPANTFVDWSTVSLSSAVKYTFTEGVHDIKVTMGGASHLYAFNICAENTTVAYPLVSRSVLGNIASNHPHRVGSSNFGFRTVISAPFTAFEMDMPTWTAKDAYCSIALYKWAGDYATTLAGSPVATKTFNPMTDGAWHGIYFDTALDAGEYLFYIYDASAQNCGIWVYKSDDYVADGYTLIGNTEYTNQAPDLRVTLETPTADNVFSRGEAAETYVYVNSLDGEVLYTGNVALGEITDAMLAQLNAYANGTYNTFVKFELLSEEDGTYTFYSIHNTEADVTVNGGEAEEKDGYYVLTADAPEEGKYFAGWYIGDVLISYSETFKFFPNVATADLVAKYDTEAPAKNSDVGVEVDRTSDKLTVSVFPIYGDNAIVEFGYYVATSTEPMDAAAVIANGKKLDSHAPHAYMVRVHDLLETTKAQNIYIVGYFTYNDGEAIQTEPTDVIVVEVPNA